MNTITLDIRRKHYDGSLYIQPVTFSKHDIKGYGPFFKHSCILFKDPTNPKRYIEAVVDLPYSKLKEELDLDVFEKIRLT